ncbi:MAG: peptide chain release factor 1 [Bacteriovoracaceae bacterium]|jgi:peptide chain release factor 1|nr:peptide chain release factor 1 [Bacteriovoracaceae bacterium]
MFDKLDSVISRYEQLTEKLADPSIYDRQKEFKEISSERSGIEELVHVYREYKKLMADLEGTKDILRNEKDEELREMAKLDLSDMEAQVPDYEERLRLLLLPKDPLDEKNVIMEMRAGAGGDEASIFVGDMFRMYQNYFKTLGFKVNIDSISEGDQGMKEIIFTVEGEKVYSKVKWEAGVHRVQRVPKTETMGRVHTSTITVAVMPEVEDLDFELNMNEVRVDVYRSSGAGGQSVNTTDSAVRMTHIPTGISVACQDERSQLKNKAKASRILKARIYEKMITEQKSKSDAERKSQVGEGDRSEKIRTYNYPQNRVTDHRIGLTSHNLEGIMAGDLAEITNALIAHHQAELLKGQEE